MARNASSDAARKFSIVDSKGMAARGIEYWLGKICVGI
jgi:hypothetical protein